MFRKPEEERPHIITIYIEEYFLAYLSYKKSQATFVSVSANIFWTNLLIAMKVDTNTMPLKTTTPPL
jgi:hypothetical protein